MVEPYLRRSPLAGRNLVSRAAEAPAGAGVLLGERAHRTQVDLRGRPDRPGFLDAAGRALGFPLPVEPNTTAGDGDTTALWLGPDEWLIVAPPDRAAPIMAGLRAALVGQDIAVTDVSEARTVILVAGPRARDLLAKGTPLDIHPRVFGLGRCAQTVLARTGVILHPVDERPVFEVYVLNSYADYLFTWLERAGAEYGVAIMGEPS
ncbi:MAG: sarcosine oxidase subunit gamma [Rhodospirillaceae bacterium]|nr:sarcosine oxidase subunit gamma [Rhodospirillaceae bacterium]